jgi:hypothetical protein
MKRIPLTQGQFAKVDDEDYEWLMQWKWHADWCAGTGSFYVRRSYHALGKCTGIKMHREIMSPPKGLCVDHINRDTTDNRRSNLRICTSGQNIQNSRAKPTGTASKIKGVTRVSSSTKWRARIRVNGTEVHLGCFTNKTAAALAYSVAAKRYFGEFARTFEGVHSRG